jgi:ABC-type glycerol-3-phosphate transport system substrate-binding protein
MYRKLLIGVLVAAIAVTAASVAFGASSKRSTTQLTLWHNYGTEGNAVATNNLV